MEKSNLNMEEISFLIIAHAGEAKSHALMALDAAKNNDWVQASKLMIEANKSSDEASKVHMDVVTEEANGNNPKLSILFMHAEDQMMNTQTILLLINELIELYKRLEK